MTAIAPVVLDLDTLRAAVTLPAAVHAVENALRALARGEVTQPPPTSSTAYRPATG